MKRILVIAMVVLSGTVFGTPDNTFDVNFDTESKNTISVSLKKERNDRVTIQVLTADRFMTIHKETIKGETEFKKRYDFSSLKDDNYIISVSNGVYVYEKTIRIDEDGITEDFGASILNEENGIIEVNLYKDISKISNIKILNESNVAVYETGRVWKRGYKFDIRALPSGRYRLEVIAPEITIAKSVDKI